MIVWISVISAFLLTGLQPSFSRTFNVSVSDKGRDTESCILNGSVPCCSLDYAISSLKNLTASEVFVLVISDQSLKNYSLYSLPNYMTLVIKGADHKPSRIRCANRRPFSISSWRGNVSMERLTFERCSGPHGFGLTSLRLYDVTMTDSKGIGIIGTTFVNIMSSGFSFVQPYSREASLVISHDQPAGTTVFISDSTFTSYCTGPTVIWVTNGNIQIRGNITVANSTGYLGGAVRLTRSQVIAVGNASVSFVNNFAQYGSAVYMEDVSSCPLLNTSSAALSVKTINSKHSCVYIANPTNLSTCLSPTSFLHHLGNSSDCTISTSATSLSVKMDAKFVVIPGKDIIMNLLITDYFQNRATCEGSVYINQPYGAMTYCNSPVDSIHLSCPSYVPQNQLTVLASAEGWNSTAQVQSEVEPSNTTSNISITLRCEGEGGPNGSVSFQLQKCPVFIMQFNDTTHTCECISPNVGKENYMCSVNYGVACIQSGYWRGWDQNQSVVIPCIGPACKESVLPCPLTTDTSFHLLSEQPDNQCSGNKAGLLCSRCKDGYYLSYPPLRCIRSICSLGRSFGLLIILIAFEFMKVIIMFMVVSNKLGAAFQAEGIKTHKSLGVGYFFGSLFYLASIGRLPILTLPQFKVLKLIVELFRTITHLPLDIFGEIEWCFFPSLGPLGIFTFQFIGPATAITMLMALYILVRLCPRALSKFQPSPMQSISLLVLFTFWSLAATSINILQSTEVQGDARVKLQPDLPYFTGLHLPLTVISIIFLLFLVFPLVTFLMFSQYLWKCINLSKVKPFLDEFQSCYKNPYRWYPSIYFIAWLVIVGADSAKIYLTIYVVVFFTLCVLLAVFQPYEVRWLNTVDMLLLLDLLVMTLLLLQQKLVTAENKVVTGVVYLLVLVPFTFMSVGIIILFAIQFRPCINRRRRSPEAEVTVTPVMELQQLHPAEDNDDIMKVKEHDLCVSRDSIIADD